MNKGIEQIINLKRNDEFSPRVGLLYSMMERTRENLVKKIEYLSPATIDYSPDKKVIETIGTLLLHIAAVEWSWIFEDIDGKEMEYEKWKLAFSLRNGSDQITGKDIKFYMNILSEVRRDVFDFLRDLDDDKLDTLVDVDSEKVSIEWILFHLIEHEAIHIGQVSFLNRLFRLEYLQSDK